MKKLLIICLVFLSVLALKAENKDYAFGKKLKQRPVSLTINLDETALRIPNQRLPIGIEALMPTTEIKSTRNLGGKLGMRNFIVQVEGGEYSFGKITIDADKFSGDLVITVSARKFPEMTTTLVLPLHKEMQILVDNNALGFAAPGEKYRLSMQAIFDNGDRLPIGNRTLPFRNYNIHIEGGTFRRGKVLITEDLAEINQHQINAAIVPKSNPEMITHNSFKLDYIKDYRFATNGFFGSGGSSGFCAGSGSAGSHGGHGEDGYRASDIHIYLSAPYDEILAQEMIYAEVSARNSTKFYLINPNGGTFCAISQGGDGGNGGDGGDGGNGHDGMDGSVTTKKERVNDSTYTEVKIVQPGQDGGHGGDGGFGGHGGFGGDGGDIIVHYQPEAEKYLDKLFLYSRGGDGGFAGRGGSGGRGGNGGDGEPDGSNGHDGLNGGSGNSGIDGYNGRIHFIKWLDNYDSDD